MTSETFYNQAGNKKKHKLYNDISTEAAEQWYEPQQGRRKYSESEKGTKALVEEAGYEITA